LRAAWLIRTDRDERAAFENRKAKHSDEDIQIANGMALTFLNERVEKRTWNGQLVIVKCG